MGIGFCASLSTDAISFPLEVMTSFGTLKGTFLVPMVLYPLDRRMKDPLTLNGKEICCPNIGNTSFPLKEMTSLRTLKSTFWVPTVLVSP